MKQETCADMITDQHCISVRSNRKKLVIFIIINCCRYKSTCRSDSRVSLKQTSENQKPVLHFQLSYPLVPECDVVT